MNKRRRYKAKQKRRETERAMAILGLNYRNAKAFLVERNATVKRAVRVLPALKHRAVNPYRAVRQFERMVFGGRSIDHYGL